MPHLPKSLVIPATRRFQTGQAGIISATVPKLQSAWDDLDNYDEDAIDELVTAAEKPLRSLKSAAVRQALGLYTVLAGVRPPGISVDEVPTVPDLRSPFISVWQALKSGTPYPEALLAGRSRIEAVISDFAVSSARQTGDVFVEKARVHPSGWERITDANACDWCDMVAEDIYSSADAADFGHDRCGCTAVPAFD